MLTFDDSGVAWVLVFSGTQVQPQIILDLEYLSDYLSVSYDYDFTHCFGIPIASFDQVHAFL